MRRSQAGRAWGNILRRFREDIKRIFAVYYEQNVTTDRFEDFDGERWIMPED